jgi:predicted DNA-binding protein with PD1-like motif
LKACEGRTGRVFIIRLEHGDKVPECIERFAAKNKVVAGHVIMIGGMSNGEVISGPKNSDERPPQPIVLPLDGAHEVLGTGILAPNEHGKPELHMHAALGRAGGTMTGCLRQGVLTWLVGEVIIYEILGTNIKRIKDAESGFSLLNIEPL